MLKEYKKIGDSGNELTRHFCSQCGSPIYTSSPRHPESNYLKAGCVDNLAVVHLSHQNWMKSRVSWATIPHDLPGFQEGPASI